MKQFSSILQWSLALMILGASADPASTVIEWDAALRADLDRMADHLSASLRPWSVPDRIFRVESYGAKGDGTTINTAAIQNAIDECTAAGGGVVLFSKGDYVTGTFEIKSGVMIEVAEGTRILGSTSLADYPERIESFKSVMSENHKFRLSLIYAEKARQVGIRGLGEIYFRGEKTNFSSPQTVGPIVGRPFGIRMIECSQVVLQDITLRNAAAWMQNYLACEDLIFERLRVINHANFNNDGLDPDGCRNVIVRHCFINSEDDAMCFKGASGRPCENVLVEDSTFVTTCNAFKFGTDTGGDFRNVRVRRVTLGGIPETQSSSAGRQASTGITLATVDGGNVENVYISDTTINQARCPIFLRIGNRGRVMPGKPKPPIGRLRRVLIEDVTGRNNYRQGSFISGIPGSLVEDVVVRRIDLGMEGGADAKIAERIVKENEGGYPDAHQFFGDGLPAYGFWIRHARNIRFEKVRIVPKTQDARPLFGLGGDTSGLLIDGKPLPLSTP